LKDAYREVPGPFSEIRRMNRNVPACLTGTIRSQSFSLSQRLDPHSSSWLCFTPHPLIGFLPPELPSPPVTPFGDPTTRSPPFVDHPASVYTNADARRANARFRLCTVRRNVRHSTQAQSRCSFGHQSVSFVCTCNERTHCKKHNLIENEQI
jgi:hypothetical protein